MLRIQKTLEDANLKLTQVMSDIVGVSGRAILNALIAGETDPERLADLTTRAAEGDTRAICWTRSTAASPTTIGS